MWENTRGLFLFPAYFWQKWAIEATWAKTLPQIKNQQGENGNLVDLWTGTGSLGKNTFFSILLHPFNFLHFLFAKKGVEVFLIKIIDVWKRDREGRRVRRKISNCKQFWQGEYQWKNGGRMQGNSCCIPYCHVQTWRTFWYARIILIKKDKSITGVQTWIKNCQSGSDGWWVQVLHNMKKVSFFQIQVQDNWFKPSNITPTNSVSYSLHV